MTIQVQADAEATARAGAAFIAAKEREAIAERGRFIMAVSGGRDPWRMLSLLGGEPVTWEAVQVVQVDERVAPAGDPDRNLTHLGEALIAHGPLRPQQVHAMPVEEMDLEAAAAKYDELLRQIAGSPPVLDLVHLGLGPDGHTASLVPGDPVLQVTDRNVALTGIYQRHARMTLTYPMLNRARCILWLATGPQKAEILQRLAGGDPSIPASRIRRDTALVLADRAAAGDATSMDSKGTALPR